MPVARDTYRDVAVAVAWVSGWRRLVWWLRYWTYITVFHRYDFLKQDIAAIGMMPDSDPAASFRPDISIASWRELVETGARNPRTRAEAAE